MLASATTLFVSLALAALPPQTTSTQWESDYGKALAQTRSDSKPLLVVLDKPGSDKEQIAPELLKQSGSHAPLAKYDLCHVDVSTKYGQQIAKVFKVNRFPHVAIIDSTGKSIVHRHPGQATAAQWTAMLTKYQASAGAVRVIAAKPVVSELSAPSAQVAQPVVTGPVFYQSTGPTVYAQPISNCPNCQRNR